MHSELDRITRSLFREDINFSYKEVQSYNMSQNGNNSIPEESGVGEASGSSNSHVTSQCVVEPFSRRIDSMVSYPCKDKVPQVKEWNKLTKKRPHAAGTQFGLLCGKTNGFLVVDCDLLKKSDPKLYVDGLYAWNEWIKQHGDVCGPRVKTGSGGLHVYFCYDPEIPGFNQQLDGSLVSAEHAGKKIKIDVLTDEKNVIAPGSPNYEYLTEEDKRRPLVPLPPWLKEILTTSNQPAKKRRMQETRAQHTKETQKKQPKKAKLQEAKQNNEQRNKVDRHTLQAKVEELDASHAASYDTWTRVLWAICNTARENNYDALDIAVEFSRKCPTKFRGEEDVRKVYEQARNYDGLGFRYIVSLAGRNSDTRSNCLRLLRERLARASEKQVLPVAVNAIERVHRDGSLMTVSYTDECGARTSLKVHTAYAAVYDNYGKFWAADARQPNGKKLALLEAQTS
ncbi:ATPase-like protein [Dinothrombium tinctorium]|uniref:ATPase-like protein n=1 Tax=Dinothrombium tinctorium TaxID=1965070 RepID=A0A443QN92_9ACAR|nr:ATPase-like protein [Dinothrombium tinctorium]